MSKRPDLLYCQDILESGEAIGTYVEGIDFATFVRDRMRYSAVIREFEIIGEAVGKLAAERKQAYPDVPWQDIKDFRNLLAHEYFGVDLEIVWNTIRDDLPSFPFLHSATTKGDRSIFSPAIWRRTANEDPYGAKDNDGQAERRFE